MTWTQPTLAVMTTEASLFHDKPAIAVSMHSGSLGYIYVAYVRYTFGSNIANLYVVRSTNGGETFDPPIFVASGNLNGAQILVNNHYGHVYVLWTDFSVDPLTSMNAIRMSTSTDFGQTWSGPEKAADVNAISGDITGEVRAPTFSMARFNWVANRISVVWHEREHAGSGNTDVYYTAKSPSGWQSKVRINDVQTNDQFMPAIDFDLTGNLMVSFYDRRDDQSNLLYHEYSARIDPSGNRYGLNERVSTFQSNPLIHTLTPRVGDYHDIWSQSFSGIEYFLPAWVGIPTVGDIYISALQPVDPQWIPFTGATLSTVAVARNPVSNVLHIVARGTDGNVYAATFNPDGTFNNNWTYMQGQTSDTPALVWNTALGKLSIVVRRSDNSIWAGTIQANGVTFDTIWTQIPGSTSAAPALAWNSSLGKLSIVVRGNSGSTIWAGTIQANGVTFDTIWAQIPGSTSAAPALAWNSVSGKLRIATTFSGNLSIGTIQANGLTFNNDWAQVPGSSTSMTPGLVINPATGEHHLFKTGFSNDLSEWRNVY